VHLNLPFREPLSPPPGELPQPAAAHTPAAVLTPAPAPGQGDVERFAEAVGRARRPLLIAGAMAEGARLAASVAALADGGLPVLAEPSSQLRLPGTVASYEALLRDETWAAEHQPDLVVRVGAIPTSKPLNQWLAAAPARTLLIDPDRAWADPDYLATDVFRCDALPLLSAAAGVPHAPDWAAAWSASDRAASEALDQGLAAGPLHEGAVVRMLSRVLTAGSTVFAGSSMPIRAVDAFWPAGENPRFFGNRGASGIDGLVSTGLGLAAAGSGPTVLLLGDLSLYHDMNGLLAVRRHGVRATLVVLDNGGGGIFGFLPQAAHEDVFEELFLTPLGLKFEDVARLYGLDYVEVGAREDLEVAVGGAVSSERPALLRIPFSLQDSIRGHRACWTAVSAAIRSTRPTAPGA
jgi:2-succinyl-5-enolpyruvyl-6-hydroxy-3-cyclohexene-1-carboxylate synthase